MVSDGDDGISMLRSRIERRKRVGPTPRQPELTAKPSQAGVAEAGVAEAGVAEAGVAEAGVAEAGVAEAGVAEAGVAEAGVAEAGRPDPRHAAYPAPPRLVLPQSNEPLSERGVGVRLDDRVADLISELRRRHGIRIRKAELLEVLISELPLSPTADFVARVKSLRQQASPLL